MRWYVKLGMEIGLGIALACLICGGQAVFMDQWRLANRRADVAGAAAAVELQKATAPNGETRLVKMVDGVEYAFRWCPPGEFKMGSPWLEAYRQPNETRHHVTLTKGFWMLETEVTQGMWQSVMGESISDKRNQVDPEKSLEGEGSDYPMYYVSWNECQEFCRKLSEKIGMKIALPTEAQWEYACRAGTVSARAGSIAEMGWYDSNSDDEAHPVGRKQPNAWGLYDMHGNVDEWCQDWLGDYPRGSVTDPMGPASGSFRVTRGGGWFYYSKDCRSAARYRGAVDDRICFLGFRVVGLDE